MSDRVAELESEIKRVKNLKQTLEYLEQASDLMENALSCDDSAIHREIDHVKYQLDDIVSDLYNEVE